MADKKKINSEASSSSNIINNGRGESVVVVAGRRRSSCGYCKSGSNTSITHKLDFRFPVGAPLHVINAFLTTNQLKTYDKARNVVALALSPVVRALVDPDGAMTQIRNLDNAQLIDPTVKGTLNVLKSAAKVSCLKRVVFTSSMAAVIFGAKAAESGVLVDETWFSDPVICVQKKLWYMLSKTLAEDVATKFSKENGLELVIGDEYDVLKAMYNRQWILSARLSSSASYKLLLSVV